MNDEYEEGYKCDIEQYRMLKRCSDEQDLTEWNDWRKAHPDEKIFLQGADLSSFWLMKSDLHGANCQRADFKNANCQRATFWKANCQDAYFREANCQGVKFLDAQCLRADFEMANCEGADFWNAKCQRAKFSFTNCQKAIFFLAQCQDAKFSFANCHGANFRRANCQGADFNVVNCQGIKIDKANLKNASFQNVILNHETQIIDCKIDDKTDFTNASLSSVIIEPGKRAKLEQNIRRFGWEKWYGETATRKIATFPVRFFWLISDYGYNTKNVLFWFLLFIIVFATIYTLCPSMLAISGEPLTLCTFWCLDGVANFWQMLAFATSTMVTLGFSNINVAVTDGMPHMLGMIVVSLNLMVGYFMLAVLVTRLAILFQTMGPGYVPIKQKDKMENDKRLLR
ncbi:pentapeptide repeat-containing protein [Desulfosarcina sp. OttesenSCG-928-A07]|nr:pentapeptide repeat-containing protein [Desulfosarcina sp. OttesenSCG-928-G17]MDL2329133.1 pentapeptide repeat-containing protein [Desulfosarcina sp. OttesenSCG-928-A07]